MSELSLSLDVGAVVERARSLWRTAAGQASQVGVELYTKVAVRLRAARSLEGAGATIDRSRESGLAVRLLGEGRDHAGFAAASGISPDVVRWAMDTASKFDAMAPSSKPDPSSTIAAERWDLDMAADPPNEPTLAGGILARPELEWVEAGTTVEVLIGAEGWLAARRRHRVWALRSGLRAGLVAQRGFDGWERLLDDSDDGARFEATAGSADFGVLVLAPEAATSVVAALVDAFHGPSSARSISPGLGWEISDQPVMPDGLAGGSFDDAGFPAGPRVLAAAGSWMGRLSGPGTLRRASFREPPTTTATNLIMDEAPGAQAPRKAVVARRCRVLRLSPENWVLGLDLAAGAESSGHALRWVRVNPEALLAACASRLGRSRVTPTGPIVPGLVFEGILKQ